MVPAQHDRDKHDQAVSHQLTEWPRDHALKDSHPASPAFSRPGRKPVLQSAELRCRIRNRGASRLHRGPLQKKDTYATGLLPDRLRDPGLAFRRRRAPPPPSAERRPRAAQAARLLPVHLLKHLREWSFEECERPVRGRLGSRAVCLTRPVVAQTRHPSSRQSRAMAHPRCNPDNLRVVARPRYEDHRRRREPPLVGRSENHAVLHDPINAHPKIALSREAAKLELARTTSSMLP